MTERRFANLLEVPCVDRSRSGRCLYVGKGPSATRARENLDFGDVATVNSAAVLFDNVMFSFWCDVPPASEFTSVYPKCRYFIVPCKLHNGFDYWHWRWRGVPVEQLGLFPAERTLVYPYNFIRHSRGRIRAEIAADRVPMCMTGPAGLFILSRYLGYRDIWCFGHDGGFGHCSELTSNSQPARTGYNVFRRAMETVADCLRERWGTQIHFWPDRPPQSGTSQPCRS
jgi:hypothetical protein